MTNSGRKDALMGELEDLRFRMRGISPKLDYWKQLKKRSDTIGAQLAELKKI